SAGFYLERFRGNDDLAGVSEKRAQAADQLADLFVGWSKMELGHEPHYEDLRRFLDVDFRRDLKNLTLYWWLAQISSNYKPEATEEFIVRFSQYLIERDYFKARDLPNLIQSGQSSESFPPMPLIQALAARKLGVEKSKPLPKSLAFLADPEAVGKSWEKYLATTELYQDKLRKWESQKSRTEATKPEPAEVVLELAGKLIDAKLFGEEDDHLTVRLTLSSAPIRTNGKWDGERKQVIWDSGLEPRRDGVQLPILCYASWGQADESFQKKHFGRVLLEGDDLMSYCFWRASLDEKQGGEWEAMLVSSTGAENLNEKLREFRFGEQPPKSEPDRKGEGANLKEMRRIFTSAIQEPH
ncbi:MAG: hypothetical protein JWR69_3276, partial [Pedosphaera sp.]|nr:hypothetical protein [Pedosphaera sp.]